jgi:hypothetical protein
MGLSLLCSFAATSADEEDVPLDQVPKAVLDAVKTRFKGAELKSASKETEDGQLVYEVTIKLKGRTIDTTLTPPGKLLMIEEQIDAGELPKAVSQTLRDKYPKAAYKIIEKIIKVEDSQETLSLFEVLLETPEKQAFEVQLNPEGKVVIEEKKGPGDDDG